MKPNQLFRWIIPALILSGVFSCMSTSSRVFQERGLVTGRPGMNVYSAPPPGESAPATRVYKGAPPVIPHKININPKINVSEHACLNCHLDGLEVEGHVATKIPASHRSNAHTGEKKDDTVVGIRYNCIQCHVPQSSEETPLSEKSE